MEREKSKIWKLAVHAVGGKNDIVDHNWVIADDKLDDHENILTCQTPFTCDVCERPTPADAGGFMMWVGGHRRFSYASVRYRNLLGYFCGPCQRLLYDETHLLVQELELHLIWRHILKGNSHELQEIIDTTLMFFPVVLTDLIWRYALSAFDRADPFVEINRGRVLVMTKHGNGYFYDL